MSDLPLKIEARIKAIKREITTLGAMRPGSISIQYRDRQRLKGPYHQISYSHGGRSGTDRIHPNCLKQVEEEILNFKLFRQLTNEWIELSLKASKLRMKKRTEGL